MVLFSSNIDNWCMIVSCMIKICSHDNNWEQVSLDVCYTLLVLYSFLEKYYAFLSSEHMYISFHRRGLVFPVFYWLDFLLCNIMVRTMLHFVFFLSKLTYISFHRCAVSYFLCSSDWTLCYATPWLLQGCICISSHNHSMVTYYFHDWHLQCHQVEPTNIWGSFSALYLQVL